MVCYQNQTRRVACWLMLTTKCGVQCGIYPANWTKTQSKSNKNQFSARRFQRYGTTALRKGKWVIQRSDYRRYWWPFLNLSAIKNRVPVTLPSSACVIAAEAFNFGSTRIRKKNTSQQTINGDGDNSHYRYSRLAKNNTDRLNVRWEQKRNGQDADIWKSWIIHESQPLKARQMNNRESRISNTADEK